MTPQQIVGLGVRLFAVWLALLGLGSVSAVVAARNQPGMEGTAYVALLLVAVYWFIALSLWFFPMVVAHRLVPKTRFENVLKASSLEVARVGAGLLGLWLLATALPAFVYLLISAYVLSGTGSIVGSMDHASRFAALEVVLRIIIALLLLLRSAPVARALLRSTDAPSNESAVRP